MTEKPFEAGKNAIPEDVASLYSRAQMQGTRYWDFSASRNEVRGQFRHRLVREPAESAAELVVAPRVTQFHASRVQPLRTPPAGAQPAPSLPVQSIAQNSSGPVRMPEPMPPPAEPAAPRWFALHALLDPGENLDPAGSFDQPDADHHAPVTVVCSLAGGVGKTCLVATLGRALAALGEHVLLADTAGCGLLPLYFGSADFKPGLRTFSRPGAADGVPVDLLNLPIGDATPGALLRGGRGAGRILVDVATASRDATSRLLQLQPTVLAPILPDMSSLACLAPLEALLDGHETFFLLNQFDGSSLLHLEMREMLQQRLGARLLPFVVRRSPAFGEALADGMTVIDYAPGSAAAEDYLSLAAWMRDVAAPWVAQSSGRRWRERCIS